MKTPRNQLPLSAVFCVLSSFALSVNTFAEPPPPPPNPLMEGGPPPEFDEDNEFVDPAEGGFDFGAQPDLPPPQIPPPSRVEIPNDMPSSAPPLPSNEGFAPPARAELNQPSSRPAPTPPTRSSRPGRASMPTKSPGSGGNPAMPPSKNIPKRSQLADYLQLDSSVKGLQVKNFDLPDKEIRDVVTLISKWTGKNFIIDSKVRGKITILGPSQVTLEEAYQAFLSALDANGLTTVKAGKFIRIIESAEARRAPVETFAGDFAPDTDQFITRIFQLKYINADEVQREFRDLTTRQGKLFAYEPTNSIIITDTGSNIRRIEEIIAVLDVKGFETKLHVLPIKHTSSKAIAEMLDEIYSDSKGGAGGGGARPRSFRRTELERTRGGGIISKIIPDEQTNSLVVLANASGFIQLKQLVSKLDVKAADTGRIHVYYCEYAKAEDLAATLSALAGGGGAAPAGRPTSRRTSVTGGAAGAAGGAGAAGAGTSGRASGGLLGSAGPVSADLGDGVKITSDASTNSLVITASAGDFKTLKRVIRKLDIPRLQVFVETAILEVNLDKSTDYGVNLAASQQGRIFAGGFIGDSKNLTSLLQNGVPSSGITIPIVAGRKFVNTLSSAAGSTTVETFSFMGLLSLITQNTSTSVLSTPQIIALDNEEAEFKVLDETPVQTSFVTGLGAQGGGFAAGQGNIERLKTGIEIKLTPHVNAASKQIRLEIAQKIDSIKGTGVPQGLGGVQIATTSRETNTSVVVKDNDFVMLGGLMSDKVDEQVTKVPLLGDIPILGWLFKAKNYKTVKTNLVILLRPKIIGTSLASAKLIDEGLKSRQNFMDETLGTGEMHKEGVNQLQKDIDRQKGSPDEDPTERYRNNEEEEMKEEKVEE
jgi:general secretion pathway protein D